MPEVSDVDLMELADGTLAEPRRRLVEAELARRPELQQRFEAFLVTGKPLARLFDPVVEASVPSALVETIRASGPVSGGARKLRLVADGRPTRTQSDRRHVATATRRWPLSAGMAMAAGLVMAVGLGWSLWILTSNVADGPAPGSLAAALEVTPSAQTASVALEGYGGGVVRPSSSFQHVDGRYCRQYDVSLAGGRGLAGFACKSKDGRWQVEKEAETAAIGNLAEGTKAVRPAGPPPGVKIIDDAVEAAARGDSFEPDKELALIRSAWQRDDR